MPDGDSQVKKGRKFAQVVAGARDRFLADGYEGSSVDEIARAAGVSKATLYSYFPDKKLLFMEVAKHECRRQADLALESIDVNAPVKAVLCDISIQILNFLTSDFGQRIFRICVAEGERFPELGQEFYESGPAHVRERLIAYFQMAIGKGDLKIDDLALAADQLAELCKADIFPRLVFCIDTKFDEEQKLRVVNGAVEMFMARYGT